MFTSRSSSSVGFASDLAALHAWTGSRLVVGFDGVEPNDLGVQHARQLAEDGAIGGLIFFRYNITSPTQVAQLIHTIRSWNIPAQNRPLLLMVDQEGGRVQRLDPVKGFSGWPCAYALGKASDQQAEDAFKGLTHELAEAGFNFNAAPVVDLHDPISPVIGQLERSFSKEIHQVVRRAGQAVQAHLAAGIIPAIKHFPGHGSAKGDTHRGITDVSKEWQTQELTVFTEMLKHHDVPVVMTSHLINTQLDPCGLPATFSQAMVTDILRHKLGFKGVVITDDLGMGAIEQQYKLEETVHQALACGHDLLCFGLNQAAAGKGLPAAHSGIKNLTQRCVKAVQDGVQAGTIDDAWMFQSSSRLAALRKRIKNPISNS